MLVFTLRRLGASALLLFLVLTATFLFIRITPGEPSLLYQNPRLSEEQRQKMRRTFGLDQPLSRQYVLWMGAMARGDWGISFTAGRPALEVLLEKMPNTMILAAGTLLVECGIGLSLGVLAAARAGSRLDRLIRWISLVLWSMPSFWLALIAIEVLTVQVPLFPTNQMISDGAEYLTPLGRVFDLLHHLTLPALVLGIVRSGEVIRFTRNGLLEILEQDFIRTARAKGLSPARVLWVHALRNAVIPLVQRFGISLPLLLSGTLIIEVIFSWPGVGQAIYRAMLQRDYPVILASTALAAGLVILGNLAADLTHAWIDPRIRHD